MINTILEGVTTYEYLENILLKDEKNRGRINKYNILQTKQ